MAALLRCIPVTFYGGRKGEIGDSGAVSCRARERRLAAAVDTPREGERERETRRMTISAAIAWQLDRSDRESGPKGIWSQNFTTFWTFSSPPPLKF